MANKAVFYLQSFISEMTQILFTLLFQEGREGKRKEGRRKNFKSK